MYEEHRFAYTHIDTDNLTRSGKPTQLFVCKCNEAFDHSAFNEHIRDSYKVVG